LIPATDIRSIQPIQNAQCLVHISRCRHGPKVIFCINDFSRAAVSLGRRLVKVLISIPTNIAQVSIPEA